MRKIRKPSSSPRPYGQRIQAKLCKYHGFVIPGMEFEYPFAQAIDVRAEGYLQKSAGPEANGDGRNVIPGANPRLTRAKSKTKVN